MPINAPWATITENSKKASVLAIWASTTVSIAEPRITAPRKATWRPNAGLARANRASTAAMAPSAEGSL